MALTISPARRGKTTPKHCVTSELLLFKDFRDLGAPASSPYAATCSIDGHTGVTSSSVHQGPPGVLQAEPSSPLLSFITDGHRLGVFQRPLTRILPQKHRDTNGSRIVIQIGGVYTTFCQAEGIHWQKYAIEMGGVSRYFSKVSGSGVDLTLLFRWAKSHDSHPRIASESYRCDSNR